MNWRRHISQKTPWIPSCKRQFVAARDSIFRSGGSQCGEDEWVINEINKRNRDWQDVRYIEVGANQPTQLSNTWQMSLRSAHGILIEPDPRCVGLLRRWRPNDLVIQALAGDEPGVKTLKIHHHTTMNAIDGDSDDFIGSILLPVVTLDMILNEIQLRNNWESIDFLSIDTEGHDTQVLNGARQVLERSDFVCLEHWGSKAQTESLQSTLGGGFKVVHETRMNVIFGRF